MSSKKTRSNKSSAQLKTEALNILQKAILKDLKSEGKLKLSKVKQPRKKTGRKLTEEHKAKMKAGKERKAAAKEAPVVDDLPARLRALMSEGGY